MGPACGQAETAVEDPTLGRSARPARLQTREHRFLDQPTHGVISMDRRLVLTGLAGLAAAPALAQTAVTPQSPAAQSGGAAGGLYGSQGATSPAAGTQGQGMSQAEQQWMQQTMMVGSVALQTSEIALQKAEDEDVKKFAKFEADEQKGVAEVLDDGAGRNRECRRRPAAGREAHRDDPEA